MKMKRLLASVLALLLVVSILPIGALAANDNPEGTTVAEIAFGDTMNNNRGTVTANNGQVSVNYGNVETNNGIVNSNSANGKVDTNNGTIVTNNGGTVSTNSKTGTVETNYQGTIETNNGTVKSNQTTIETNNGKVLENAIGSTVETNAKDGKIETNNGTVGKKDKDGNAVADTGNSGTININYGTVITNNETGTVETNAKDGKIETNNGTVGEKDDNGNVVAGSGNSGTIKTNNGTVITNNGTGTVETNAKGGKIETNEGEVGAEEVLNQVSEDVLGENWSIADITKKQADAIAQQMETKNSGNFGTITDNKGKIYYNGTNGFIETNNNAVGLNNGTVKTNNEYVGLNNGTVKTNNEYVGLNNGTVETNDGGVNLNNGTVETNNWYVGWNTGVVETNAIDGFVGNGSNKEIAEYGLKDSEENEASPEKGGVVEKNFGTVYDYTKHDNEDGLTIYYGLSWGENTDSLNLIDGEVKEGTVKNLDEIASSVTRDGYRMTGYTAYSREDGKDTEIREETNHYTMYAPTWLKILWEKIVTAVGSNEPEAKKTSIPTTLSADQVKVGAYVRRGNLLFRIIEVGDDYIRVATVPKLSEQALADMLGFLKQHLSDAQIAKIDGEPALLEQELVTYFFGGTSEHISFYAAPDLFA